MHNFEINYYKIISLDPFKKIANIISTVGNPMSLGLLYGIYIMFFLENKINYLPLLFVGFIAVPVSIFTAFKVKNKEFTDYDVSNRISRKKLYKFTILLFLVLSIFLVVFQFDSKSYLLSFTFFIHLLISYLINQKIKISMHSSFAFLFSFLFYVLNLKIAVFLLMFAFLIAWSRIRLRRHQPIEVIYGALLGCVVGLTYLAFFLQFK